MLFNTTKILIITIVNKTSFLLFTVESLNLGYNLFVRLTYNNSFE